jgi:predicted DNA-binding protein (MmcQ/YjbR family)
MRHRRVSAGSPAPHLIATCARSRHSCDAGGVRSDPEVDDDAVVLSRVRRICLGFAGAEEGELQDRPLFHVRRRRFAIFNGSGSPPRARWAHSGRSLHFLADPLELDALRADRRFAPSPHHGDRGWMAVRLDRGDVDWTEVAELLDAAYRQVVPRTRAR